MRNANLASPAAGQHREAWSKEPPVTAERRCNPRLIWIINIEKGVEEIYNMPCSIVAFLLSTFFFSSGNF